MRKKSFKNEILIIYEYYYLNLYIYNIKVKEI